MTFVADPMDDERIRLANPRKIRTNIVKSDKLPSWVKAVEKQCPDHAEWTTGCRQCTIHLATWRYRYEKFKAQELNRLMGGVPNGRW